MEWKEKKTRLTTLIYQAGFVQKEFMWRGKTMEQKRKYD